MKSNTVDTKTLILHDIRSAQNVGSIFRTADAVGIDRIYLSRITPTPIDRFGRSVSAIAKTALGAEHTVPWESYSNLVDLIDTLKQVGVCVVAIEQSPTSIDYKMVQFATPIAFILGNEVDGLPSDVLALCNEIAHIPMKGTKESLNVSVAAGVALYRMLDI